MMFKINYKDRTITCKENETVLNAFFRNRIDVPFSCRKGTCQVCVLKVDKGTIPAITQKGLKQDLIESRHFLPCQCVPESDMKLSDPLTEELFIKGKIHALKKLSPFICQVAIELPQAIEYKTGQFINIKPQSDSKTHNRSYSITTVASEKNIITIDVQLIKHGVFSGWVFNEAKVGDVLDLQIPLGECYHTQNNEVDAKLVATSGSGLGAGLAIAAEAFEKGFQGIIKVCHYSRNTDGWYHTDLLNAMSNRFENFRFWQALGGDIDGITEWLMRDVASKNVELYMFGSKHLINTVLDDVAKLALNAENIHYDSFDFKNLEDGLKLERMDDMEFVEEPQRHDTEDHEMWAALGNGELLKEILHDFYSVVFEDELLAPFFKGVTKNHVIGKQFSFLQQYYQGGDMYFGDRPRNAHHWMVISHDLFDHRENLFKQSCVKMGLKDPHLSQILELNESYRKHIVKSRVWPRITNGVVEKLKGYEELVLDIGGLCDGCGKEIPPMTKVQFHGQTGEMFCPQCSE